MDAVSEVLIARAPKDEGLSNSMLGASAIAHVVAVGVFVFLPAWWFGAQHEVPETIMQISLGGPIGPNDGGVSTLSSRAIQTTPLEPSKKVEPVRPPSATAPEMILPTKAPPKKISPTKAEAKDPRSTKPTVGKEIQQGTAIAETKATTPGFGLSSGGGGGGGYLEVSNFCCPEYLTTMTAAIKSNWNSQQGAPGRVHLRFVIQKDGRIVDITVEKSSGVETLDLYARRALILTKLPPLPAGFFESALAVHLYFEYSR
jgi:TonB family protein